MYGKDIDPTTKNAIFAAARTTTWKKVSSDFRTEVKHGSETWTVLIPASTDNPQLAEIAYCEGYGGVEFVDGAYATWGQTGLLVETAMAAVRTH